MKILYITAEGFDTPNPNNQMAEVMIRDFLDNGYSVHLIQSRRKQVNPDIPASLENREGFTWDTVDRKIVDKSNFIKRYFNDVQYAFSVMRYWVKVKDANVIYLQSNPTIIYTMLLLNLFKRLPIVYSIYDVFPGHAYDIGVIRSKFVYNVLRIMQKPCYKIATAITVLSDDMRQKVVEQGAMPDRVFVVPPWFDVKTAREVSQAKNRFIKKYNIPKDKFYVQFAGTVGYVFNYKTVIELAKRIQDENNIVIQIVGDGNIKEKFMAKVENLQLKNIEFFPLQPVDLVPDVYSACNLCIIPLQKGVIGNGVPSKAPILMACKRVIINSVEMDSQYAKMFAKNDIGVAVDIYDYDGLADAVRHLFNSPEDIKRMANNAYEFGKANYSSTQSTDKIMHLFEKIGRKSKKMKILIIGFTKIKYMPYMNFYLHNTDVTENNVHLLYWNRDLRDEDTSSLDRVTLHEFRCYQEDDVSKVLKLGSFIKYRKYVLQIIKSEKFDFIYVLHSLTGVLIADKLKKHYSGRYIFDYRDSTYESFAPFKKIVANLVKGSYATFVSSDAFRIYLPQSEKEKIYTSHNILIDSLSHRDEKDKYGISSDRIRIAFWGFIRHEEINLEIIKRVGADSRFELHYYGREQQVALNLKQFVKENGINNVFFHGEYKPEERYEFVRKTDIIHNIYYDNNMMLAMANKYYDGAIFRIPQICMIGSFMAKRATETGIGCACDPYDANFTQDVYKYYKSIDPQVFRENCDRETKRVYSEYVEGTTIIKKISECGDSSS